MQDRRARGERLGGAEDRRQRFVIDVDKLHRPAGGAQILRRNHGHQLAVKADFIHGDEGLVAAQFKMLMSWRGQKRVESLQPFPVQHTKDTRQGFGFGRVDRQNPGVRIGAEERGAVGHSGKVGQILDILRLPDHLLLQIGSRLLLPIFDFRFWILD